MPDDAALRRTWHRAWQGTGGAPDASLFDALVAAWMQPQRHYHTLQHLGECIARLEPALQLAEHPGEVALALWFHDAVYDVQGRDNELRSAQWLVQCAQAAGVADAAALARLHGLVMATRHAALPATADEQLLVDVDLSILGAPRARFDEYEQQVRQEYAWVPEAVFRQKRREVLRGFLDRPFVYGTQAFRQELEQSARDNLRASIARLG
jgi:predicted metal-dependent HD superfamily phosphohydrolase